MTKSLLSSAVISPGLCNFKKLRTRKEQTSSPVLLASGESLPQQVSLLSCYDCTSAGLRWPQVSGEWLQCLCVVDGDYLLAWN